MEKIVACESLADLNKIKLSGKAQPEVVEAWEAKKKDLEEKAAGK